MDKMGLPHQFFPPGIRPLRQDMIVLGRVRTTGIEPAACVVTVQGLTSHHCLFLLELDPSLKCDHARRGVSSKSNSKQPCRR